MRLYHKSQKKKIVKWKEIVNIKKKLPKNLKNFYTKINLSYGSIFHELLEKYPHV